MEQSSGEYNNVYKYNGKEFDEATQLYYYGARYYDPNKSIWLSVDPLAVYNPVMESEFYGDGQHNGGVYNSGNLNPYIYCYQNPIVYVDPNGKQNYSSIISGKFSALGRAINFIKNMDEEKIITFFSKESIPTEILKLLEVKNFEKLNTLEM